MLTLDKFVTLLQDEELFRINCTGNSGGVAMMAGNSAGRLKAFADSADKFAHPCAITLEDNGGAGLTKCLTV
jgi:hypothetical protein